MSVPHTQASSITTLDGQFSSSFTDFFNVGNDATIIKAINECPQVSAILLRKSQCQANGITTVTQPNGKPMRGEDGKQWQKLIDTPNPFQNREQYVAVRDMYLNSWGWVAEYKQVSVGFGIVSRKILVPNKCRITWKRNPPMFVMDKAELIERFDYSENGKTTQIYDLENIYFYVVSNFQSQNNGYLPQSPLTTLTPVINTSIANWKSRKRGIEAPWGVMSNENKDAMGQTKPSDPKDEAEWNKKYRRNYGTGDNQSEMLFSKYPVSFQSIMPPISDLKLIELLEQDGSQFCNVMGFEMDLLAQILRGATFTNKNEANKLQYQNHEMPRAKDMDKQEMESLGAKDNGFIITTDFSHVACLQEDYKMKAEALRAIIPAIVMQFKNNLISYGEAMATLKVTETVTEWNGKFWKDLTTDEKALFDNSQNNQNNGNNNQTQDTQGTGGNQGNQGSGN